MNEIPDDWHLCDGTNGTPDLRDRFLTGAGSSYALGDTGGENFHQLTINEMPSHNHSLGGFINIMQLAAGNSKNPLYRSGQENTSLTGGDQPHENRPPFYAVYYIMKMA